MATESVKGYPVESSESYFDTEWAHKEGTDDKPVYTELATGIEVSQETAELVQQNLERESMLGQLLQRGRFEDALIVADTIRQTGLDAQDFQEAIRVRNEALISTAGNPKLKPETRNRLLREIALFKVMMHRTAPVRLALDLMVDELTYLVAEGNAPENAKITADLARQKEPSFYERNRHTIHRVMNMAAVLALAAGAAAIFFGPNGGRIHAQDADQTDHSQLQALCEQAYQAHDALIEQLTNLSDQSQITEALNTAMMQTQALENLDAQTLFTCAVVINPEAGVLSQVNDVANSPTIGLVGEYPELRIKFNDAGTAPELVMGSDGLAYYVLELGDEKTVDAVDPDQLGPDGYGEGYVLAYQVIENPVERYFVVAPGVSNIRAEGNTSASIIGQTEPGQVLLMDDRLTGDENQWVKVILANGSEGFIRADQLEDAPMTENEVIGQMSVIARTPDGESYDTGLTISDLDELGFNPAVLQASFDTFRSVLPDEVVNPLGLELIVTVPEWPADAAAQQAELRANLTGDLVANQLTVGVVTPDNILHEEDNLLIVSTRGDIPADADSTDIRFNNFEAFYYITTGQLIDNMFNFNQVLAHRYDFGDRASFADAHEFSLVPFRDDGGLDRLNMVVDGETVGTVILRNLTANGGNYDGTALVMAEPGMGSILAENSIVLAEATAAPTEVPTDDGSMQLVSSETDNGSFYVLVSNVESPVESGVEAPSGDVAGVPAELASNPQFLEGLNNLHNWEGPIIPENGMVGIQCVIGELQYGNLLETFDENTQGVQIGDINVRIWAPCYYRDNSGNVQSFNLPLFARRGDGEAYLFDTRYGDVDSSFWTNDVMAYNSLLYSSNANFIVHPGSPFMVYFVSQPGNLDRNLPSVEFAGNASMQAHSAEEVQAFINSGGNLSLLGVEANNFVMPAMVAVPFSGSDA